MLQFQSCTNYSTNSTGYNPIITDNQKTNPVNHRQHNTTIYVDRYLFVPIQHCALYPLPVIAFSLHTHFSVSLPISALHTTLCGSPTDGS